MMQMRFSHHKSLSFLVQYCASCIRSRKKYFLRIQKVEPERRKKSNFSCKEERCERDARKCALLCIRAFISLSRLTFIFNECLQLMHVAANKLQISSMSLIT